MNVVMTGDGRLDRGAGDGRAGAVLASSSTTLLDLAAGGIEEIGPPSRRRCGCSWLSSRRSPAGTSCPARGRGRARRCDRDRARAARSGGRAPHAHAGRRSARRSSRSSPRTASTTSSSNGGNVVAYDPTRIAAQIVTGIGFLGAGAIIRAGLVRARAHDRGDALGRRRDRHGGGRRLLRGAVVTTVARARQPLAAAHRGVPDLSSASGQETRLVVELRGGQSRVRAPRELEQRGVAGRGALRSRSATAGAWHRGLVSSDIAGRTVTAESCASSTCSGCGGRAERGCWPRGTRTSSASSSTRSPGW